MKLPVNAVSEWSDWGDWLCRNTADYYVAMDTYLAADQDGAVPAFVDRHETRWHAQAERLGDRLCAYLVLACGGELRHKKIKTTAGFKISASGGRWGAWTQVAEALGKASDALIASELDAWADDFTLAGNFGGAFGGKPWAQACRLAAQYLRKELTAVLFCEFALNLHHNCAIIFNKLSLDNVTYLRLLDAGFKGVAANWPIFKRFASEGKVNPWIQVHDGQEPSVVSTTPEPSLPHPSGLTSTPETTGKKPKASDYNPEVPNKLW